MGGGGALRSRYPWGEAEGQRTWPKDVCGDSRLRTAQDGDPARVDNIRTNISNGLNLGYCS